MYTGNGMEGSPLTQKENQKQNEKEFWVWFSFFLTCFSFLDESNEWSNKARLGPDFLSASTERED
jgi:hypothetical protein